MLIRNLQQKIIQKNQPLPVLDPEINWDLKTLNVVQSIYLNLPLKKIHLDPANMKPTPVFLQDLQICRMLPNKRLKYEFFNMMVRKYGFLYWQLPSLELGNFLELECQIEFKNAVKLEEAVKQLKAAWKNHLWKFLQDFKKNSERRISIETLKDLTEPLVIEGDDIKFSRKIKGICGSSAQYKSFEPIWEKLTSTSSELFFVRAQNIFWDINQDQFIFRFHPFKNRNSTMNKSSANIIEGIRLGLLFILIIFLNQDKTK